MSAWHTAKTGTHQGLIIDDATGRNVAVSYDAADAALIAAAPELLAALDDLLSECEGGNLVFRGYISKDVRDKARACLSKVTP